MTKKEWEIDLIMERCAQEYPNVDDVPDGNCQTCEAYGKPGGCVNPSDKNSLISACGGHHDTD